MRAVKAHVEDFCVVLTLDDASTVERDFSLVEGPAVRRIVRANGLDPRVRIVDGALSWPNEIDFELDLVLWGWPKSRRKRPLPRALIGTGGMLIAAPVVNKL